ncbi:hypothetical protein CDL15_Pgr013012 [Punica granatum]|uniref:Uncharacterized protein n=1 Tax=Punica granatum TaxID=22663 RepID=A0A218XGE0_PUNGR|nr:hypothetical protein CDL15_Pgr013012 [Punica granatum]
MTPNIRDFGGASAKASLEESALGLDFGGVRGEEKATVLKVSNVGREVSIVIAIGIDLSRNRQAIEEKEE